MKIGPYETGRVYCGDCLELMKAIPDGAIDAVVTSPPYNQKIDQFKPSGMHKESRWVDKISHGYSDSMSELAYHIWQSDILYAAHRITKDTGSCFYNHKIRWRDGKLIHPIDIVRDSPWNLRQEIVWARNGSCTLNARMFAPNDERIYWLSKGRHKWNQAAVSFFTVWRIASCVSDHACAFPIEIPRRAMLGTTDSVDVIIDPFAGSGTTGVACVELGRAFLGFEIDPEYCKLANDRIEAARKGVTLKEHRAGQKTLFEERT